MIEPRRMLDTTGDEFERALLSAARHDDIPADRRDLLFGALGVSAGGVAGVAVTTAAAQPALNASLLHGAATEGAATGVQVAGGASLLLSKAMIATGIGAIGVALATAVVFWKTPEPERVEVPAVVVPDTAAQAPRPVAERADAPEGGVVVPSPNPGQSVEVAPRSTAVSDSLTQELALIESARGALARKDGARAVRELDSYAKRFPNGSLRTEAKVMRIEALILRGDRATAARIGHAMLQRSPKGPYARRIRSLLGEGDAEPTP